MKVFVQTIIFFVLALLICAASETSNDNKVCPPSKYLSNGICARCPDGHYCPGGAEGPIPCSEGTYAKYGIFTSDRAECKKCPAGTFQDKKGQNKCIKCVPYHKCDTPGLAEPVQCNQAPADGSNDSTWCTMSMVKQLDEKAYIQSVPQINDAIIKNVYRWQRPLADVPFQIGVISHSGLIVETMDGKFYMVQLEIIRHKGSWALWGYGDIFVDECPGLDIKVNKKGQMRFNWWRFHYLITDGPKTPVTGQWSVLDSYLRMTRASYSKYDGRYYWTLNNCHQVERAVREAMGILS